MLQTKIVDPQRLALFWPVHFEEFDTGAVLRFEHAYGCDRRTRHEAQRFLLRLVIKIFIFWRDGLINQLCAQRFNQKTVASSISGTYRDDIRR